MSTNPDLENQQPEVPESSTDDGVREIFPVRMVTTSNVTDYRPRKGDPAEPAVTPEDDVLGKDGDDSAQESASSEASTPSTEPPTLTTGVQLPVGLASGLKVPPPPAAS